MFNRTRIPGVTPSDAHVRLTDPDSSPACLLVDVREPDEVLALRAEGIVAMPLSTFMLRHAELPKDRPLLVICESGGRSAQAAAYLIANGWSDVTNVVGGTLSWERAGLPVRRGPLADGEGELPV